MKISNKKLLVVLAAIMTQIGLTKDIDITFFITSDTHYGVEADGAIPANQATIDIMNAMPGTAYPVSIGGTVDTPRGVVVTGDLTEAGLTEEWGWFTADYGINGEGRVNYPVYEGWGTTIQALLFRPELHYVIRHVRVSQIFPRMVITTPGIGMGYTLFT